MIIYGPVAWYLGIIVYTAWFGILSFSHAYSEQLQLDMPSHKRKSLLPI